jgi:hypothetical protein
LTWRSAVDWSHSNVELILTGRRRSLRK